MTTQTEVSNTPIESVKISSIQVVHRRRQKVGAIATLARSLERHGLIHPVLIATNGELVVGARRLAAADRNGWKTIPARRVELSLEETQAIELAENEERSDLNAHEAGIIRMAELQAEVERLSKTAPGRKSPKSAKSLRTAAIKTLGSHPRTVQRDEEIIADVKDFPVLESWSRRNIKRAANALRDLPPNEHNAAERFIGTFEPREGNVAAEALENMLDVTPPKIRKAIYAQSKSKDPKDVQHAQDAALQLPPAPDAFIGHLKDARRHLKEVVSKRKKRDSAQGCVKRAYQALQEAITLLDGALKMAQQNAIKNLGGDHL